MVVHWSVDCLGRNLEEIAIFFNELHSEHTGLYLQQQHLDTYSRRPSRQALRSCALGLLSAFGLAESERGIGQAATKSITADRIQCCGHALLMGLLGH
jgi:hypothetical protein